MNRVKLNLVIFCSLLIFLNGAQGAPSYQNDFANSHYLQHQQSIEAARTSSGIGLLDSHHHDSARYSSNCNVCGSGGVGGGSGAFLDTSSSLTTSGSSSSVSGAQGLRPTIVYTPYVGSSGVSESHISESQKYIKSQNSLPSVQLIAAGGGGKSEFHENSQKYIQSNSQVPVVLLPSQNLIATTYPSFGSGGATVSREVSGSRYVTSSNTGTATVPVVTYTPSKYTTSSNFGRYSENHLTNAGHSGGSIEAVPAISTSSNSGRYSESHLTNAGHSGGTIVAVPTITTVDGGSLSSSSLTAGNHYKSTYGATGSGRYGTSSGHYGATNGQFGTSGNLYGTHLGTSSGYGHGSSLDSSSGYGHGSSLGTSSGFGHTSSSLDSYMSESERLARLQAGNIHNTGSISGGALVNSDFDSSNSLGLGGVSSGSGNGGYRKTHSWEKSSKWASGSSYDSDGRTDSYNHLSTAEQEQKDVNGRKAGYAAATTTLDDNGKVSTYTIHTP